MKYIDADKLKAMLKERQEEKDYREVIWLIDSLQQEQPKLTQVPRIEQETQKKGWMDYGLLISEIGLHRSNAIDRIKETKERATEIKRNIAPHDLAILGEYLESVGKEIVLCCLQRYCMDFMFTQDEVKEIIQQEQPEFNIPSDGSGAMGETPPRFKLEVKPVEPEVDLEKETTRYLREECSADDEPSISDIARHFYELGRKQVLQEIYEGKAKPVDKITAAWLDDESKAKEDK